MSLNDILCEFTLFVYGVKTLPSLVRTVLVQTNRCRASKSFDVTKILGLNHCHPPAEIARPICLNCSCGSDGPKYQTRALRRSSSMRAAQASGASMRQWCVVLHGTSSHRACRLS